MAKGTVAIVSDGVRCGVNGEADFMGISAHLDREDRFRDKVSRVRSDDRSQ